MSLICASTHCFQHDREFPRGEQSRRFVRSSFRPVKVKRRWALISACSRVAGTRGSPVISRRPLVAPVILLGARRLQRSVALSAASGSAIERDRAREIRRRENYFDCKRVTVDRRPIRCARARKRKRERNRGGRRGKPDRNLLQRPSITHINLYRDRNERTRVICALYLTFISA